MYRNTYVEINLDRIALNTRNIINRFDNYKYYFGVVKGFAYGHGEYIVNTLIENGINYLAVSSLEEAISVRKFNTECPILCLMPISLEHLEIVIKNNVTLTVHDYEYANKLVEVAKEKINIHIKIDSGMSRLGINDKQELKRCLDTLNENKNIMIEGIYTHMATAGISDPYWDLQVEKFKEITSLIDLKQIPIIHIDRSLTMMCHNKIDFCNGVRIGISLYGYNQVPVKQRGLKNKIRALKAYLRIKRYHISKTRIVDDLDLKQSLSFFSEVIQIKKIKAGSLVGYGESYKTDEDILVALIPVGYQDGIDLRRSGSLVFIGGKKYEIIGTINMSIIIIKVDENIKNGDTVELVGDNITVRYISNYIKTTVYETITTISSLIPRVYIKNGQVVYKDER